jgi:uroporphyrinogen decarboxylase
MDCFEHNMPAKIEPRDSLGEPVGVISSMTELKGARVPPTGKAPEFNQLLRALRCGVPDRVPLAEITIDEGAKEAFLQRPVTDLSTDVQFYIEAGYDFLTLGRRIAGYPPVWPAARAENYYDVQRAVAHGAMDGTVRSREDYRAYPWMKPAELDFGILDRVVPLLPPSMRVIRYCGPVFQMTWMLMGFEALSYALSDDPGLVVSIMDRIFDLVRYEVEDAVQRDVVGAVWFGDDIAIKDRLMVAPEFLRAHFFPKLAELGRICAARGIPLIYHTDGNVTSVLPDIIAAGVSALHPIDPLGMDIVATKAAVSGRLCVIGGVDVGLLLTGTPLEVAEETRRQLGLLAPGGGYVLGSSNSIPRTVPAANYRAMLDTVRWNGVY